MTDRVDGRLKVTGAATYAADNRLDRLAYGYLVTSTVARGTIVSMDTAAASKAPGVLAVYTPFDPLKLYRYTKEQNDELTPPLQDKNVRYFGQAIGLVVAETFEQARDAASLIQVRYDARPAAASFHDGLASATDPPSGSPISEVLAPGVGSIDDALNASEITVSATYTASMQNHNAMEPHPTVAAWDGDHLTLYTATQGVMLVVARIAEALGIDTSKIHVRNPYVGGGFGNKWGIWAHTPLTAAAARALGRPVKTALTREQTFTVVGHRPASQQTVSLGAARDGTLKAIKNDGVSSKSASNGFYEPVANLCLSMYASPNIRVSRKIVTLDVPVTTIMRAPQEANGSFALESAVDELAVKLGMDPLELRRKNDSPVVPSSGLPWSSKHLDECYRIGAERFGWSRRRPTPGAVTDGDWLVGLGMATATYGASRAQASVKVRLLAGGTAVVSGTGADLGTGQSTVWAILAAESLGIPVGRIRPDLGDSSSPVAANAGGSGSTSTNGPAVQLATEAAKTAMIALAVQDERSPFHGKAADSVRFEDGRLKAGDLSVPFGSLLTSLDVPGVEATATSAKNGDKTHGFRSFGAHFCEVRVNAWTGEPRVSRWLTVLDAGRIVNEKTARNQIIGGVVMGIGHALLEETRLEPATGRIANADLASYLVPVNADIPRIDVHFLDYPDTLLSPLGARGIGEFGIVGAAGAVANAIYNATGKRVRDLPITLEKLLT
ncbi:xanthine dehydrogenase family protein molybdopterin-binding subunit [Actinoallomurus purpureus]|uniref:xanthine dehydrogenase family protein molybdopterin-binding subunit n=1 Tax=Actinoallomurus purpureus TaxID=478114 RepID=UPI0020923AE8|nr:xanthine dehydrogenase family protein molybdopterin-binding subunit [Actinoallomurus purpureus]MCO6006113.1 xanthine dehydrogenase family protein molybdopterin-binding subunit [Actinoallomurus purpureus]